MRSDSVLWAFGEEWVLAPKSTSHSNLGRGTIHQIGAVIKCILDVVAVKIRNIKVFLLIISPANRSETNTGTKTRMR